MVLLPPIHWPDVFVPASKHMRNGPFNFLSYLHTYTHPMKLMDRIISLFHFVPTDFSKSSLLAAVCLLGAPPDNNINEQVANGYQLKDSKESQFCVLRYSHRVCVLDVVIFTACI